MVIKNTNTRYKRERSVLVFSETFSANESLRIRLGKEYLHIYYRINGVVRRDFLQLSHQSESFQTRRSEKGFGWGTLMRSIKVKVRVDKEEKVVVRVSMHEFTSVKSEEAYLVRELANLKFLRRE